MDKRTCVGNRANASVAHDQWISLSVNCDVQITTCTISVSNASMYCLMHQSVDRASIIKSQSKAACVANGLYMCKVSRTKA